jgi:hypothetical protein
MLKSSIKSLGMLIVVISLATIELAFADIFMKQKQHTDSFQMMGQTQPAKDEIRSIWIAADRIRSDGQNESIIIRLDKNIMYMVNHGQKTYSEMPMNFGKIMEGMMDSEADKGEQEQMQKMMQQMMKMSITVTPTSESKKISSWSCKKYLQSLQTAMGQINSEVWASEDIHMDPELYAKFSSAMLSSQPGMQQNMAELVKEMKKIKGVAVLTTTTMNIMNNTVKSSTELLEYKNGTAPSGSFEVPAGYSKKDFGRGMNRR